MIRRFRYMLTRLFFLCMGLRVSKYRKEVEALWALSESERKDELERLLRKNRPLNAAGEEVTSLARLFSSPPLSKQGLRQQENHEKKKKRGSFGRHTAGTTGEPTHVSLSRSELGRMLGVRDYCFRQYGVKLGDREARFWGRPECGLKSYLKNFLLNRKVCFPVGDQAREAVAYVMSSKPEYLYGYSSLLLEAAALVKKHSLHFVPPKCVVCTAETITPEQKNYLNEVFRAPVVEEYGATEFDIIAFECSKRHRHLVNPWIVVREGGESLLVSDLSRQSVGLVNYNIGDFGAIKDANCLVLGGPTYLAVIEGRSIHRFAYIDPETRFHSVDLAYAINEYQRIEKEVFNFRIVQNQFGVIDLYVNLEFQNGMTTLQRYVENAVRRKIGREINVRVITGESLANFTEKSYFIQKLHTAAGVRCHDEY